MEHTKPLLRVINSAFSFFVDFIIVSYGYDDECLLPRGLPYPPSDCGSGFLETLKIAFATWDFGEAFSLLNSFSAFG